MSITEIAWERHHWPRSIDGPQGVHYYRADVSGTDYLTVRREDGEFRWDIWDRSIHTRSGHAARLDGGSRPTLKAAKAAALAAWNARQS